MYCYHVVMYSCYHVFMYAFRPPLPCFGALQGDLAADVLEDGLVNDHIRVQIGEVSSSRSYSCIYDMHTCVLLGLTRCMQTESRISPYSHGSHCSHVVSVGVVADGHVPLCDPSPSLPLFLTRHACVHASYVAGVAPGDVQLLLRLAADAVHRAGGSGHRGV